MKLLWIYLLAFLLLPAIGEIIVYSNDIILGEVGTVSIELILYHLIFVFIVIIATYFTSQYKRDSIIIKDEYSQKELENIFFKSIVLMFILTIVLFLMSGYKIIYGLEDRGEIRVNLGVLGPIHTMILSYWPVSILTYTSVLYYHSSKEIQGILRKRLILLYLFPFFIGFLSGYKAVSISLLVPGLVILYLKSFNFFKLLIFSLITIFILTLFTVFVMDYSIYESFNFIIHRATVMSAYGTIGFWNTLGNISASSSDLFADFMGSFGETIANSLLGFELHSKESLKINLSNLVTYLVYPATDRALAGSVNVTVTAFAHSIYIMGKELFVFYALIMGTIIGLTIKNIKKCITLNMPIKTSLYSLYFFYSIIPALNSGSIYMLFNLPMFVYLTITYFFIVYFIKRTVRVN